MKVNWHVQYYYSLLCFSQYLGGHGLHVCIYKYIPFINLLLRAFKNTFFVTVICALLAPSCICGIKLKLGRLLYQPPDRVVCVFSDPLTSTLYKTQRVSREMTGSGCYFYLQILLFKAGRSHARRLVGG